jgi:peroxisomal coenzyme A diphosphatase NUDT7
MQYREAHEEVSLPLNSPDIHTLCTMEPFLSSSRLFVVPVVALLTNNNILGQLEASVTEVSCIFNHPLEAILDPTLAENEGPQLVPIGSENWPYKTEYHVCMA